MNMGIFQNIIFPTLKGEHTGPKYYLLTESIYGLNIHDAYNKIGLFYTWNLFEVIKGMNNITSCFLSWINNKDYYYQSYVKNHKIPEIAILVDNCSGKDKNNTMI